MEKRPMSNNGPWKAHYRASGEVYVQNKDKPSQSTIIVAGEFPADTSRLEYGYVLARMLNEAEQQPTIRTRAKLYDRAYDVELTTGEMRRVECDAIDGSITGGWIIFYVNPPQGGPSKEILRLSSAHILSMARVQP